jgi:16S rRNA (adenine1518-N6/adenine1519-N6)-dimethyltransferase
MKLSEVRATLQRMGITPARALGQNFLHDQNLARWIVDQAEVRPDEFVVEIGPGLGALTKLLLEKGARVLAIEKDKRLASFLRERLSHSRLEIANIDALEFDPRVLFAEPRVKLLGNLPYNVSSALLLWFVRYPSPISLWLFTLQREMALRLSATPSTPDYGALTLRIQLHHQVQYLRTIPPAVFFPRPEVDSAVIRIVARDPRELPEHDDELLLKLIRRGFSQRRKQLRKLLRENVPDWDAAARAVGFDSTVRAEQLSLLQWINLANYIAPAAPADGRPTAVELFPVVDRTDRILRLAPRGEVHANNLLHRAVHILILNPSGEVYLQQRSRRKDRHALKWDSSAAGHVGGEEAYDEAAHRELREELGIDVPLREIAKLPASPRTDQEFVCLYRGKFSGQLAPNRAEIETGAFFPETIIDSWVAARPQDFAPGFIECWRTYRQRRRRAPSP